MASSASISHTRQATPRSRVIRKSVFEMVAQWPREFDVPPAEDGDPSYRERSTPYLGLGAGPALFTLDLFARTSE